ncbi:MAG: DUF4349 domain-containing protein [Oscillospiraceae bacterium]|nr:DUF4349 domain-containing protein [Oscillospiraceae bacterium]
MKKIRISCIVLAAFMLLSLLAGCSASSKFAADNGAAPRESIKNESQAASEEGYYEAPSEDTVYGGTAYETDVPFTQNLPDNAKLIYTASVEMETTEFDAAAKSLNMLANEMGGYFESSSFDNYSNYRHAYYTVRVPSAKFADFYSRVGENCTIKNKVHSSKNIGEDYYDVEARLVTQKTKLERLQALLAKSTNLKDIITLEGSISETELAIEHLSGTLRKYDSLVGYSTIDISLREVYRISETEEAAIGFGAKLAAAFKSGGRSFVDGLQSMMIGFARNWAGWLIFIIIVVVVWLVIRGVIRRRRKKKAKKLMEIEAAKNNSGEKQ